MDCLCRPSRVMSVRIVLLDETDFIYELKDDLPGQALLDVVFARLNLIETSYFGIRYIDEENQTHWLDAASRLSRQLKPKAIPFDLYFGVKFYAADPCKLLEEITRYQLFLQVKQDVLQGRLPVSFELAAELGAFVVQSELGDYDQRRHSKGYVSEFRLLPNQSSELEVRVGELHQQLKGMTPATAELNYLDKVKWHDMYGVDLHPVLGEDSVEYFLGLTPSGIVVLRNKTTVAHYYWPRIAKVYYKGRYFMLRICDKNNELSTYGFETPRKSACKHLWRCCVEHHAFFRLVRVAPLQTSQSAASDLFALGSRSRYSGRTEKQAAKDAMSIGRAPPAFTRVPSKRQPRRVIDDFLSGSKNVESFGGGDTGGAGGIAGIVGGFLGLGKTQEIKNISILQQQQQHQQQQQQHLVQTNFDSPYRSTYSIPTSLGIRPYSANNNNNNNHFNNNNTNNGGDASIITPDSPRSTRSAPWTRTQQRSLFGNNPSSPRSVRSAGTAMARHGYSTHAHASSHLVPTHHTNQRYRSSSVESHSSNDSRSTRRHKHRHRRTSDNESELSRGSGRSGRSHHSHRKHRRSRHRRDSGGSENDSTRGRSYSGHRISSGGGGSAAELIDSTSQWREVQRRQAETGTGQSSVQQASVSKSSMVARSHHSNESHSDTHSHHKSRRHKKNKSPSDSRNRIWSSELAKHLQFGLVDTDGMTEDQLREIPYTVVETNSKRSGTNNLKIHKNSSTGNGGSGGIVGGSGGLGGNSISNGVGSASGNGQGKNRVDRIRGLYFQSSNPNDSSGAKNGSIRSASTISSRECDRNSGLVRMMSSMSMGDFISPTGSSLSPLDNSALRVSHEHTDSGLGADQDYAYSSERSSDSTRYGTNKSSGASSGSHRKSGGGSNGGTFNNMVHQSVSNNHHQQQQQQQQQQRQAGGSIYQNTNNRHQQHQSQSQSQPQQQPNYKYTTSPAPIHNNAPQSSTNQTNNNTNNNNNNNNSTNSHNNNNSNGNGLKVSSEPAAASSGGGVTANNNRLLVNYTTFENNHYKFCLNNPATTTATAATTTTGGGVSLNGFVSSDGYFDRPQSSAASPYYYGGPSSVRMPTRGTTKSDIGVPIRRPSAAKSAKQQLPGGGIGSFYHQMSSPSAGIPGMSMRCNLPSAKSDLFLSYIHSGASAREYERPHIYNYQMPMPPPLTSGTVTAAASSSSASAGLAGAGGYSASSQQQQQTSVAYHISGIQTADFPPMYKAAASPSMLYPGADELIGHSSSEQINPGRRNTRTSGDILFYPFDTKPSKMHHQKPTSSDPKSQTTVSNIGPLIYLENPGQQLAGAYRQSGATAAPPAAAQQSSTNTNTTAITTTTNTTTTMSISPPCSEGRLADVISASSNLMYHQQHYSTNQHIHPSAVGSVNDNCNANSNTTNANRSSSLEIILTPIIQSSRRAQ